MCFGPRSQLNSEATKGTMALEGEASPGQVLEAAGHVPSNPVESSLLLYARR